MICSNLLSFLHEQEDEVIIELVNKYGAKKWSTIAQHLPGRIGKQCRERYEQGAPSGIFIVASCHFPIPF